MKVESIRIALIEPNDADVRWFRQSAKEAGFGIEVIDYSTGVTALAEWTQKAACTADVIVVADVLPMLTPREVIDAARAVHADVRVAVIGEQTPVPVQVAGVDRFTKPLSADDVRRMCHPI